MSKIKDLKVLWILVAIFGLSVTVAQAQTTGKVGINTDTPKATLDVKKGDSDFPGVIVPRVTGTFLQEATYGFPQHNAIVYVEDLGTMGATADARKQAEFVTGEGYYYFDAEEPGHSGYARGRWMRWAPKANWFYMPSISIPTDNPGNGAERSLNLYTKYRDQFSDVVGNNGVKSTNAPDAIPFFVKSNELYYYITDYDKAVLEIISLSDQGVLKYKVKTAPTPCSFINIVFVVK